MTDLQLKLIRLEFEIKSMKERIQRETDLMNSLIKQAQQQERDVLTLQNELITLQTQYYVYENYKEIEEILNS